MDGKRKIDGYYRQTKVNLLHEFLSIWQIKHKNQSTLYSVIQETTGKRGILSRWLVVLTMINERGHKLKRETISRVCGSITTVKQLIANTSVTPIRQQVMHVLQISVFYLFTSCS
eukprot:403342130